MLKLLELELKRLKAQITEKENKAKAMSGRKKADLETDSPMKKK